MAPLVPLNRSRRRRVARLAAFSGVRPVTAAGPAQILLSRRTGAARGCETRQDDILGTEAEKMNGQAGAGGAGLEGRLRIAIWGGAALLMLAAAVAARLSDEMQWSRTDFILAGAMLLGGCGIFELLIRRTASPAYRAGALAGLAAAFLTFLAAGSVGLIGSDDEPANAVYLGVIALAAAGAAVARLRARGMGRAMAAAAAGNLLAGVAGSIVGGDPRGAALATALFTPMWLLSAWLFAKAARG
jgi:hypothetical protein